MYYNITHNHKKTYIIDTPGDHVFYFENISADINFRIMASHAHVAIYGLYNLHDKQTCDISITQEHLTAHSSSHTIIKSVLHDMTHLSITGKIHVTQHAQHTDALFTNNNLLLSEQAHVISVPQLEVKPHEVTCTHAANTLPLDHEQITYLMSRGISHKNAIDMLITSFLSDVVQHKK